MLRHLAVLILAGAGLFASTRPALACSCVDRGVPLCQRLVESDAVFEGEVLDIATLPPAESPALQVAERRLVRLRVDHVWRGALGGEVTVRTGFGGGDCGIEFERAKKYLVYAWARDGVLLTGACSRTRPLEAADDDLFEFRRLLDHPFAGSVTGRARYRSVVMGKAGPPAVGYTVTLERSRKRWQVSTDADGRYEFPSMSPGTYSLKLTVAAGDLPWPATSIELRDSNSCAGMDFFVEPDSLLSTRVVDRSGRPVKDVQIDVARFDDVTQSGGYLTYSEKTAANGRVAFQRLSPGRYVMGIGIARRIYDRQAPPPTYFPGVGDLGQARVIELKYGERIDLGAFVVPSGVRR